MAHTILGQGNASAFADIHQVSEGKLFKYNITRRFPTEDKKKIILCLVNLIKERANPQIRDFGIHGIMLIGRDADTQANFQASDNISADDILVEICDLLVDEKDDEIIDTVVNHLSEQMKDMLTTNGTCPVGRASRVFEIYMFLRDTKDNVHLSKT